MESNLAAGAKKITLQKEGERGSMHGRHRSARASKRIHAKAYDHFGHRADGASVQNFSDAPGKPIGGPSYHKSMWSKRRSSASCVRMYSRITASSLPTVETSYPRAQKWCPV